MHSDGDADTTGWRRRRPGDLWIRRPFLYRDRDYLSYRGRWRWWRRNIDANDDNHTAWSNVHSDNHGDAARANADTDGPADNGRWTESLIAVKVLYDFVIDNVR